MARSEQPQRTPEATALRIDPITLEVVRAGTEFDHR